MKTPRSRNLQKNLHDDLHLVGYELALPTVLCIEGRQSRGGRTTLAMGYAAAYADTIVAPLAGEWLSRHFHRRFVECGRDSEANLATQAFYDKLGSCFGQETAFLAALVSSPPDASVIAGGAPAGAGVGKARFAEHRIGDDVLSRLMRGGGLVRWTCSGRVRAHHNPKTGIAQVTFDPLPGGIELSSADKLAQSSARPFKEAQVIGAWYGFGVPIRDPAELAALLRKSVGGVRHAPAQRAAHA
jgi:hypothetical protein